MKPAPFEYVAARSVEEALPGARRRRRAGAGGRPEPRAAAERCARVRPTRLVDINGAGLGVIRRRDGVLRIGATVRQAALERSRLIAEHWPLLAAGRRARRPRRDALARHGRRLGRPRRPARRSSRPRWPRSTRATCIAAAPLLVAIDVPPLPRGRARRFAEHARTRGVFADAGAAVVLAPGHAAVALLGAGRAARAERALLDGATAARRPRWPRKPSRATTAARSSPSVTRRALVEARARA